MTLRQGKPISLRPKPEKDGSHVMTVETPDGEKVEIPLSEAAAVAFVRTLQQGFVDRQGQRQVTPGFPTMNVADVDIAHGATEAALLVDTLEHGRMVFSASDQVLQKMKIEIDRVLAAQKARRSTN
jgi:hypothetical protein